MADEKKAKRRRRARKKPPADLGPAKEPAASRVPRAVVWLVYAVVAMVAAGLIAILLVYPASSGPGAGRDVELVVPGDESADALAARLEAAGLVASPRVFAIYLRFTGGAGRVVAGTHLVTDDLSPATLLARWSLDWRAPCNGWLFHAALAS